MRIISNFAVDRPKTMLLIILLVTLALLPGMFKLEIDSDFERQLPPDHPVMESNMLYKEVFTDKKTVFAAIVNEKNSIYNPETMKVIFEFSQGIREIPELIESNIDGLADSKHIEGKEDFLEVRTLLEEDSLPETQEEIGEIRQAVTGNDLFYGKIVSTDETTALTIFDVEGDFDKGRAATILRELVDRLQTDDIRIYMSGATVPRQLDEGISNDFSKLIPFAMLLVMVGLFFSFRTPRAIITPMVLITIANLCTLGIMGYVGFEFGPVTSIIPILIVVIGGSYSIHAIHRFYEAVAESGPENLREGIKQGMAGMGPAVTMAGLTSAFGTLTLFTFKVGSIQVFGMSGCIGILFSLVLTLTLIPAIMSLLKAPKEKVIERYRHGHAQDGLSKFLIKVCLFAMQRKRVVFVVVLILLVGSYVGIKRMKTGQDYVAWFPKEHPVRQAADVMDEKFGGSVSIYAMIDGGEPDALKKPEVLKKIRAFQKHLVDNVDGITITTSFADIIARLNQEMNDGNPEFHKIPDSPDLVSQYLFLYSMSGDPSDFDSLMIDYQQASVVIPAKVYDTTELATTWSTLQDYAKTNFPEMKFALGGMNLVFVAIDDYIRTGKIQNMIAVLITVFVFCSVVFRSLAGGFLGAVPIALATTMNFALMGFFGIRLDIASSIVTGIGVGIGVDFIIHLLFRLKEEAHKGKDVSAIMTTSFSSEGQAIVFDTASNVLAFGVFLTSFLTPVKNFGWLVGFIMINSCFATLFVVPALVHLLKPKFIFGRSKSA